MIKTAQAIAQSVAYKQRVFSEYQKEAAMNLRGLAQGAKNVAGKTRDAATKAVKAVGDTAKKGGKAVKDEAGKWRDDVKNLTPRQKGMLGAAGGLGAAAGIGGTAAAMSGGKKKEDK